MDWMFYVVAWVFVFGIAGALIAPRKGFTPLEGFAVCALWGPLGVAGFALHGGRQRL